MARLQGDVGEGGSGNITVSISSIVPWNSTTAYSADDIVGNDGNVYVAIAASTDVEPGVDNSWQDSWSRVTSPGPMGPTGPQGPAGASGALPAADRTKLDAITNTGSGVIMSSAERTKVTAITSTGSGSIMSSSERNRLLSVQDNGYARRGFWLDGNGNAQATQGLRLEKSDGTVVQANDDYSLISRIKINENGRNSGASDGSVAAFASTFDTMEVGGIFYMTSAAELGDSMVFEVTAINTKANGVYDFTVKEVDHVGVLNGTGRWWSIWVRPRSILISSNELIGHPVITQDERDSVDFLERRQLPDAYELRTTAPTSPVDQRRYLIGSVPAPVSPWNGRAGQIATYRSSDTSYIYETPNNGAKVYATNEAKHYYLNANGWAEVGVKEVTRTISMKDDHGYYTEIRENFYTALAHLLITDNDVVEWKTARLNLWAPNGGGVHVNLSRADRAESVGALDQSAVASDSRTVYDITLHSMPGRDTADVLVRIDGQVVGSNPKYLASVVLVGERR